jgi:hypothetical protein
MKRAGRKPIPRAVSAALGSRGPRRLELLLAYCAEAQDPGGTRKPGSERLRDKIGAELARLLLFALAGNQRARRARRDA